MASHSQAEFLKRAAAGQVAPVTLVHGDEPLLLDECVSAVVDHAVDESLREFNLDIIDGSRADIRDVLAKASSFPMMAERRVVVIRSFERLVGGDKAKEMFAGYVARPMETTRLVLVAEDPDFRRKPFTDLKKHADVVECKPPWDNEIPPWTVERAKRFKKTIGIDAARMLQAYVGDSLMGIHRELDKLSVYVGERPDITEEDVSAVAGASRGYTVFDLQNAIGRRDLRSASTVLRRMLESGESAPGIIVMLTRFFLQLWKLREMKQQRMPDAEIASALRMSPYHLRGLAAFLPQHTVREVEEALQALRNTDRAIKTGADVPAEMELLVYTIIRSRALAATGGEPRAVVA
ncbi:MAG: DNA polymerase III subunit delta [Bacteroidetes bacterium]|jgi:DNA polymerase-3 subunit delta|nr:DNA polymerase III subunit delta [Bacteroidota bacterium]